MVMTRAHIVLPAELLKEVDKLSGKRKRSHFIEEAVRDRLSKEKLGIALNECAGILNPADYPEWETPEKTSAWVRALRQEDEARLARKLATLNKDG